MNKIDLHLKQSVFILVLLLCFSVSGVAQDRIITVTSDTIRCKIREIGDDEVKYTRKDFKDDVVFGIDKNRVHQILFSDGKELKFEDSMFGTANYNTQKKNSLKVGFLSPVFGATSFSFEHSLKPGNSIEATLGIIGFGSDINGNNSSGAYFKFGYKFIKTPDFYRKGTRFEHILKGTYLKPEVSFSTYSADESLDYGLFGSSPTGVRGSNTMFGIMLNTGKQWVIQNAFVFDWYVGAGYGFGHSTSDNPFHFAFIGGSDGSHFAMTSGIKIGILFR